MTTATRTLYPYQVEDVDELISRPRVILGSVMRSGKMVETFELVRREDMQNVLIICPKTMVSEWEYNVDVWNAGKERYDIINYEKLRKIDIVEVVGKIKYDLIVFDECHHIKNHKAKQTQGAYLIGSSTPRVILMSGTPMQNTPADLYPLLRIIDPAAFPSYWKFVEHYCYIEQLRVPPFPRVIKGAKNRVELGELLEKYMLRREKDELIGHEGQKIVKDRKETRTIPVVLDNAQLTTYLSMEQDMLAVLDKGEKVTAPAVIAQILRLRQICLDPQLLSISPLTSHTPSAKTRLLLDLVDGASSPLIIYTYFAKYAEILGAELEKRKVPYALFTGCTSIPLRHDIVKKFQAGEYKVLVVTLKSGGEGLTLTAAHTVVFADLFWNPAVNDQAAARAEGTGQTEELEIVELWAQNTIEDYMRKVLQRKLKTFDEVISETVKEIRRARHE